MYWVEEVHLDQLELLPIISDKEKRISTELKLLQRIIRLPNQVDMKIRFESLN